jgi:hypothetical protein
MQTAARKFTARIQEEAGKDPTFQVATQPGLLGSKFHFPDDVVSPNSVATNFMPKSATRTLTANFIALEGQRVGMSYANFPKATLASSLDMPSHARD